MGAYPVIALSLKSTGQENFKTSYEKIVDAIAGEFRRHKFLLSSDQLDEVQKKRYLKIMEV